MSNQQNINFENFITNNKFKALKINEKKIFLNLLKKTKKSIKEKKNVFHSLSNDFKLNFNLK